MEMISVFIKALIAIAATNSFLLTPNLAKGAGLKALMIAAGVIYILVLCIYPCKST